MKSYIGSVFISIVLVLIPGIASALTMDDCNIGRTVYVDEFFDKEATVLERDYSDNTVKIQLSDGTTQWIKPSKLMGEFGKQFEDFVEEKAADFILDCIFGDACNKSAN